VGLGDIKINEWVNQQLNMLKESKLHLVLEELNFMIKTSDNIIFKQPIQKALTYLI